jgi:hypothetical protein
VVRADTCRTIVVHWRKRLARFITVDLSHMDRTRPLLRHQVSGICPSQSKFELVGDTGFEPVTSSVSGQALLHIQVCRHRC